MSGPRRAVQVLSRLPSGAVIGAEIGIWKGTMSARLLARPDLTLYMVDNWNGVPGLEACGFSDDDQIRNKATARVKTEFAGNRAIILCADSVVAAELVPDLSLDFVFIDADHSYNGVKSDITAWLPNIKPGGFIGGHDYDNPRERNGKEVKHAVDEFAAEYGEPLELGDGDTWFVRLRT